ncbi:MAG TPA: hypothetical protein VGY55_11970 [Pirellulales bacterium]|jgi:hypothetical protein|nr:hypothetical protein [Pirellulales bacterium]
MDSIMQPFFESAGLMSRGGITLGSWSGNVCSVFCAMTFFWLAARPAVADVSDVLTVYGPAGNPFLVISSAENAPESGNTLNPQDPSGPPLVAGNPALFGDPIVLTEGTGVPGPHSLISDVFGVRKLVFQNEGAPITRYYLGYESDSETGLDLANVLADFGVTDPNSAGVSYVAESSLSIPVTTYLDPTLSGQVYTATFFSDAEASVPEPMEAIGLVGLGGMGLIGFAWRRRRPWLEA